MNESLKADVLTQIAPGVSFKPEGAASYRFPQGVVHTRFKTAGPFSFNLNPTTLKADFELWICGGPELYYLLPRAEVRAMYDHPDAYVDARHPNLRVVSVDVERHLATYARGGQALNIAPFFRSALPPAA